jgi:hypothetical protein
MLIDDVERRLKDIIGPRSRTNLACFALWRIGGAPVGGGGNSEDLLLGLTAIRWNKSVAPPPRRLTSM